ncbi:MAG: ATP-binding cassette domain-containing protein [Anaerotignum sp.]|nr:ATP-binding cassette domain-containing protein [Anaerotignum sp.]
MPKMDSSTKELKPQSFDIELRNVSFGYDARQIINNVSLKVPQETICAFVGPSGSGKTTVCNLIARFWDVQEGQVLVVGQDVKGFTADSLMRYISMVFQNVYLFYDTIENNIRFGNPDATHERVVEAAKRGRCHAFFSDLPQGYGTVVGEGGSTLSGGEKQLISIARAILKDAPIIILDEANTSVGSENEYQLLAAFRELTKGKTLVSIAHRLTTVRDAEQILVVKNGWITQRGTHSRLMVQEGTYQSS